MMCSQSQRKVKKPGEKERKKMFKSMNVKKKKKNFLKIHGVK